MEIRNVLTPKTSQLVKTGNKVWERILAEVDKDGSGEIDFKEFKQMMLLLVLSDVAEYENDEEEKS